MKKIIFISAVCGVGKSTTCDYIRNNNLLEGYDIFDIDDLENINNYNENTYNIFYENAIKNAVLKSKSENIIIGSCINPVEIEQVNILGNVESIEMILIYCSNKELKRRLNERDTSRNCGSDEFINGQIEYQNYMLNHLHLFQLQIDNTSIDAEEVSNQIINYIKKVQKSLIF